VKLFLNDIKFIENSICLTRNNIEPGLKLGMYSTQFASSVAQILKNRSANELLCPLSANAPLIEEKLAPSIPLFLVFLIIPFILCIVYCFVMKYLKKK
jgi:hypothetical protein